MFNKWFKRQKKSKSKSKLLKTDSNQHSFRWLELGGNDNPFNKKVLDISYYIKTTMALVKKESIIKDLKK